MDEVALYHWEPNANSGKPMLALEKKGVKWQNHYINTLEFGQHKPRYLAIKPQGMIPAMTRSEHPARSFVPGPEINRWG